ncbi:glycosyltransferase family 4 protein [Piscinibacter koreensis]|uniref:Glycosyltransferase family 1 protein n=1 Tax=Piscinibacter koreensis TaxID=2742824 RepID=A0A7Y6NLZ6_9BURK|nr:glycosyltransferase family 1 protein [Schlegelella koreensis]NUZ05561.1 glycosyltransferase family 1 protein [Schlegelella koreensis]
MRIAYVTETYPPELNGVSLTVERSVAFLRGRGHHVQLIRPRQPGEAARDDRDEWRTGGLPIPMYRDLRFGLALPGAVRARLATSRPSLVHLATPGPLAWAALGAARSLGIPVASEFRTNFHQYSRFYGLGALASPIEALLRRFHNRSTLTFVPTHALERELGARGFEHLAVVGRGVDTTRFDPARRSAELRAAWQVGDAPVLITVGRIAAEKNVELVLRAFAAARERRAGLQLVVVGDGPLRAKLEAAHPEVRFVGVKRGDELAACYASADAFAFASLSETFGNVTLEALASGLPVVAFDVAAAAEHVVDGRSGALVPAGDDAAFIEAVARVATLPEAELAAMRTRALTAGRQAQWSDVLGRLEAHLHAAAAAPHERSEHVAAAA